MVLGVERASVAKEGKEEITRKKKELRCDRDVDSIKLGGWRSLILPQVSLLVGRVAEETTKLSGEKGGDQGLGVVSINLFLFICKCIVDM